MAKTKYNLRKVERRYLKEEDKEKLENLYKLSKYI